MDLHHTGYRELLYIETDKVNVTIKGNFKNAIFYGEKFSDEESTLETFCIDPINTICINGDKFNEKNNIQIIKPIFFEQNQYEIIIEGNDESSISFWHINKLIREKITPASKRYSLLSGIINFKNEIGFSDFVILVDGEEYLKITLEVFPSKISYQKDYKEIVTDLTEEIYNIVFDFLKKTYNKYRQNGNRKSSPTEFFTVISDIYLNFQRATDKIISQPHHSLQVYNEIMPSYKIRGNSKSTIKWIERHPNNVKIINGNINVNKAMSSKKHVSFDNKENRFVKYMLDETIKRLKLLKKLYTRLQREEDPEIIRKIDLMIKNIERRVNNSFLSEVKYTNENTGTSLVFSMAPGYRELYKYYLMLQRGLDITGSMFDISIKDLAVLYEYWCFIKLNSILKNKYDLISQDIIRTEGNRLIISLMKGQNSKIKYRNPVNGESIVLSYNPRSNNLPTVPQKPDNVLSLEKNSIDQNRYKYEYIFDAKYKIDPSIEGSYYYNTISKIPGPKEEDINTMHRYRDAIVSEQRVDNFERTMFGAYVLFPYSEEEKYKAHRFYKSIEKVNIGGIPFLPSATKLVEEMLDDLIADSPETAFERTTLPSGIVNKLEKIDWSKRDVLIGLISNEEQLNLCIYNKIYYVPFDNISKDKFPIHYIGLYQPGNVFGKQSGISLYGEILDIEIVKIKDILGKQYESEKLYYKFNIKEWNKLKRTIAIKERAENIMFTNLFLLQHSFNVSDLRIKSEEEYRLYYEVKRLINSESVNEINQPLSFKYGRFIIDYENGNIRLLENGNTIEEYSARLFNKRPNYWFRKMMKTLK